MLTLNRSDKKLKTSLIFGFEGRHHKTNQGFHLASWCIQFTFHLPYTYHLRVTHMTLHMSMVSDKSRKNVREPKNPRINLTRTDFLPISKIPFLVILMRFWKLNYLI